MLTLINPWAVLAGAVAAYIVGWVWYSPLLWQKPWLASRGKTAADMKVTPRVMAYGFINTLAISFVIAVFMVLTGAKSLTDALQVALLLCFGCAVTVRFNQLLYTAYPPHWGKRAQILFLVDAGYYVALFAVAGAVVWYASR